MTDAPASTTAPSAGGASATGGATPTPSPTPTPAPAPSADQILAAFDTAVGGVASADTAAIGTDLATYVGTLLPAQPAVLKTDPCASPDLSIAPACDQRASDTQDATSQRDAACLGAEHDLATAIAAWKTARQKYLTATTTAQTTLKVAVKALVDPYQIKQGDGTGSRTAHLYLTLEESAATSLKSYETSIATAAGTLATAAGTLLTAYATYVSAIKGAQTDWLVATKLADQTMWGSVEGAHFLD